MTAAAKVEQVGRADGSIVLRNAIRADPARDTIPARLQYWARTSPNQIFLDQDGRTVDYATAEALRRRYAERLATLPLSAERPLLVLAGNGIEHALLMLAAGSIGVPAAIVAATYAAAAPWDKLGRVVAQLTPGLVVADDAEAATRAMSTAGFGDILVRPLHDLAWLDGLEPASDATIDAAQAAVGSDTIGKLLFTSGSTGAPKAVIQTQRMMASNMQALGIVWPFLRDRPPVLVDWLPWNHVFGGNCCLHLALWYGGTFYIDGGRPTPAGLGRTIAALERTAPTLYLNVPLGYETLLPTLERNRDFAIRFFGGLDFLFSGGAPMPAAIRARIQRAAHAAIGRCPPIYSGWGSTETAPFATVLNFETEHAGNLGVPLPGTEIKLVPNGGRQELRVRGPNVTPGYWRQPEATAAAFDEEGFYRIGDAGRLADPADPAAGILFDGRVAEDFKLSSGTWVNVGALRLAIIAACEGLISDAVIAGEGRAEIGALLFAAAGAPADIHERLRQLLAAHNRFCGGGSLRIGRFIVESEPPSAAHDEITEKGYINQRRVLARRIEAVAQLYRDDCQIDKL
jgi:feruloyl-CoA synthase